MRLHQVKVSVTSLVERTHPALAKFLEDVVVRDSFSDHNGAREIRVAMLGGMCWQVNATGDLPKGKAKRGV
jgi:hypothetical protein